MLASSIAITALSELTTVGQSDVTSQADGFLALLNAGSGGDIFSGSAELSNSDAGQSSANNSPETPVNMPTSVFAANNTQTAPAPEPSSPQQSPQPAASPLADNQAGNTNNQTQNPSASQTAQSPAPQSDTGNQNTGNQNQNTNASAPNQSTAPVTQGQASGGNVIQAGKQLRTQIQNQLGDISQILLSMIQALSVTPAQQAATAAVGTSTSQGNNTTNSVTDGQTGGSQADQEISLLENMQSLLQQLQQSLAGQDQSDQDNVQTLSDTLLSDVNQLSQLVNPPTAAGNNSALNSLLNTPQLQNLSALLQTSISQAQAQLQILQQGNEAIYAQAKAALQPTPVDPSGQPNTQNNGSVSTNNVSGTANNVSIPVTPAPTVNSADNTALFTAALVQTTGVSQGGGNSAGSSNQDSGQNQLTQPVVAAASSSVSSSNSAADTSFTKILNQASQGSVLDQIQFQIKTALSDGSSKITIQLNPPELGKVDVNLNIGSDGKTSGITITASSQSTLDLLQRDTQGLTRALSDAGLSTDSGSLNFSLGGGQQNQTQGNQQAASTYQQAQPDEEVPDVNVITQNYVVNLAEGLDITI